MFGSLLLWCLLLVPSGWAAWRHRSIGATKARYVPLLIAVSFPALQLARFSEAASEVADRASTFVFMAMALVVGAWLASRLDVLRRLFVPARPAPRARRHDPRQRSGLAAGPGTVPGRRRAALGGRHDGVRREVGRALPARRVQRRRRRDVQPGHPELRRRHVGDPAGRLRERDPDVHLRVVRPDLAGAHPAQRGRLRGRRHAPGRPDRALRLVLRGRCRLRRGRRDGHSGDGGQVRRGARLRPGPRRPREDLRRALAARGAGAVRGAARPRPAGDLDAVAGRRDRGPARGRPAPATPSARPEAVPCRGRVALRVGAPGGDGHRRPRRTSRLRARRGRGRRRGRALRPGPAQHPAGAASTRVHGPGSRGSGAAWSRCWCWSPSDWPSGPPTTGCSTPPPCPGRRQEAPREAGRPPAAAEEGGPRAASGPRSAPSSVPRSSARCSASSSGSSRPGWSTRTRSASPPPRSALRRCSGSSPSWASGRC